MPLPDWARARVLQGATRLEAALEKANADLETLTPGSAAYARTAREAGRLDTLCEAHRQMQSAEALAQSLRQDIDAFEDEDRELAALAREELESALALARAAEDDLVAGLLPRDEDEDANAIVEVRPGVGGDEAALFAEEIFTMYERLAGAKQWQWETMAKRYKDQGLREGLALVSGEGAFGRLKFESGVHRVQRVPSTESSGRVHTSTVMVLVLPEVDETEVQLDPSEVRVEVFRASGAGGQHVNTTESAVRVIHEPTGLTVSIQDERSQHMNKSKAMKILLARVQAQVQEEERRKKQDMRADLLVTGDRSEKIRTYNYARDQCVDHRVGGSGIRGLTDLLHGSLELERSICMK
ncbi:Peptide chain release factor 1 [Hondaea fermentalgiana]|uniref:Peptide chain release factor 1 n=1 Tax=Hondaea fermentalgiana TaxID=2315210 RepID=A0A2R5GYU7_9STRA|nr:Peptide chain release factor 1 [Hondaea fermentalgiana]|eukprot:GBG33174.1 Peptide chain release factor 1 [Hondaea fermentalgiana]